TMILEPSISKPATHQPTLHSFPTRRSSDLTVSTRATARVRRYGPCRRQFEGSGADDTRSCTRCAVESEPGGRAMNCTFSRSATRSEEHTSELQSQSNLVCRLLLEKKKQR